MACHGIYDHCSRAQLWRACCDDASRRRPIRLPARSARAVVGISLWLDAIFGDSNRDHCRRGVAFGKFLGVFFPSVSSSHWILHFWKVPAIPIGPMVLGNMDVGLNTQNLVAVLVVVFLSIINIYGVKTGAFIQNIFTFTKAAALFGLVIAGLLVGRNLPAL